MNSALSPSGDTTDHEAPYSVWWDEPADQDPENPQNWSNGRKWGIITTLSVITFLTPLASAMFAPGIPEVMREFNTSNDMLATFVVSVFVLGFAFGPLLLAPLSELYGRTIIYHVCNVFFIIFLAGCAWANSMGMLIAFRFLSGFAGVAAVTCGSGSIADLMPPERRGGAMAIWSLGPLLGPVVGPVSAGFLVEAEGWRWVFWVIMIMSGTVTLVSFVVLRETYPPVLLERKAARLRKATGSDRYQSRLKPEGSRTECILKAIVRPARMFILSPIVMSMCIYIAILYGLLYVLFTTFTFVYQDIYNFSARGAGLSFISSGIGNLLGLATMGIFSDRIIRSRIAKGKEYVPEDRLSLYLTVPSALLLPLGLIMYGWTVENRVHWIAPMIGTGLVGFGMIGIVMSVQTYLIDSFPLHAASVTAANTVLRSLLGALLPLSGLEIYNKLGFGWGNTLFGILAFLLAPVLWVFSITGQRLRTNPKWQHDF
ncbi:MFS general substrate transporter [Melanomma pulvis-pyrius CBS 109.77]|uniref:MFS general substrate transporter n=1 Tax=Melanomma pulvis-pyrius CBS 109.77 TaxID=1314802 RepID=A0A6A6XKR3_9PLEO|nr:MFS general substrate transporter [Melanomma pulvis-pyrius CBS 109.77]